MLQFTVIRETEIGFTPLLGVMADTSNLKFPIYASYKMDGFRAIIKDGKLYSRNMIEIPNTNIQHDAAICRLKTISKRDNIIFDGELYCHGLSITTIESIVTSKNVPTKGVTFNGFDCVYNGAFNMPFMKRIAEFYSNVHKKITNIFELEIEYKAALAAGYEGLILRNPKGIYKHGNIENRSTRLEACMLKMKPYKTYDSKVLAITERKDKKGIAASLITEYNGLRMAVKLTGGDIFCKDVFNNKSQYIGKTFEWRALAFGMKNVPRSANFTRFRIDK